MGEGDVIVNGIKDDIKQLTREEAQLEVSGGFSKFLVVASYKVVVDPKN